MGDVSGLDSLTQFLLSVRVIGGTALALILAVGILRGKRDLYFFVSAAIVLGYLVLVGERYFSVYQKENWINQADAERATLQEAATWDFDPTTLTSIHFDWPLRRSTDGRLKLDTARMSLERIWQLADAENGTVLEVGRNPVRRAKLLLGDPRCFRDDPDLISVPRPTGDDSFARGICLLSEPMEQSNAAIRLRYETKTVQRGQGYDTRSEWTLSTDADGVIDRVVTSTGLGTGRSFYFPTMSDGPSRSFGDYKGGPIIALYDWLGTPENASSQQARSATNYKSRLALQDDLLIAGMTNEKHMLLPSQALFLACSQWDRAGAELRAAITANLAQKLIQSPKAKYLHQCGRTSCTPDPYGLGDSGACLTDPPDVTLPKSD